MTTLTLNGFIVDPRLAAFMLRADWPTRRQDAAWLSRFPGQKGSPLFIDFFSPDHAIRENKAVRNPDLVSLLGRARSDITPGNFDPEAGYLIGMVDYVDAPIVVDLRSGADPRIIYDTLADRETVYGTAFQTLSSFIDFYQSQHG